jgi:hypothetical protein
MSARWTEALNQATLALVSGRVVAAVGEPGTGRATLLGQAIRQAQPRSRILYAAAPAPEDVEAWLSLWTPELAKPETAVIVENVDALPAWGAQTLHERASDALRSLPLAPEGTQPAPTWAVTANNLAAIPQPLSAMVETVVPVSPLRERPGDVVPLARYAARQTRLREVDFTTAAERVLTGYDWPGNIDELFQLVHAAATHGDNRRPAPARLAWWASWAPSLPHRIRRT